MRWLPGNAQNIGARSEQQDSFGFSDPSDRAFAAHAGIAAVVADGMGGLANGGAASAAAVREFLEAYHAKAPSESISDALLRSIQSANQAVMRLWRGSGSKDNSGTTLAAIVLHEDWLYWVSAGDSRVYFYREGTLTRLTVDHVYAADLDEQVGKGRISREEADTHPQRAALTSYLGLETLPRVDRSVRAFPVKPGDCVLVCSDGLYRALSDEEIASNLEKDARKACEGLVQCAMAKQVPTQDNITVVAVKCRADESNTHRLGKFLAPAAVLLLLIAGGLWFWRRSVPVIAQFKADRAQIYSGQSVILRWSVNHGAVTITPEVGRVEGDSGTRFVSPQRKTTYTLIARNLFRSSQRSLNVDVLPAPVTTARQPVSLKAPIISLFEAIPEKIRAGKSAVLKWSVEQSQTVSIQPALDRTTLPPSGSKKVSPGVTTTYTLRASGKGGSALASTVITVEALPAHPVKIDRFISDKSALRMGDNAMLTWNVTGRVRSVTIDNGIGTVRSTGSRRVKPTAKTTYTLTAAVAGGAPITANVTIDVVEAPSIARFEAVRDGQFWRLFWDVSGADRAGTQITIKPDVGNVSPSSPPEGLLLKSPTADSYTLTAVAPGGTVSKDVALPAGDNQ